MTGELTTGLQAGAGGYQIHVGDSTHLVGGQLASTADPGQNVLDTGNLIAQRLHNESKYGASSVGVSGGYGAGSGFSGGLSLGVPQHGNTNSDTVSGVAAGTVIVRDGSGEGDLNRNQVTLDGNGIRNGFDAQKVQERQELGIVAGQVGFQAAGDLAGQMGWAEGSKERTLLHGVVGAAMAAAGGGDVLNGALGAAANQLAIPVMEQYLIDHGYQPGTSEFATMMRLGSTALGVAVAGGNGAATALDGTQYNYLTHQQRDQRQKELSECQGDARCQQRVNDHWDDVSAQQSYAMAGALYAYLTPGEQLQLQDTRPGSVAYDAILAKGAAYAAVLGVPAASLSYGWLTGSDGEPGAGPLLGGLTLQGRNALETSLLGPVFGQPGAITHALGGSAGQVAAANTAGAAALDAVGATQFGSLGGPSKATPVSEPWTTSAIDVEIKWGEGIQNQGMPWESYLAGQLPPGSQLPPGFKTFDFYDPVTQVAVSAKTLDTQGISYLSSPRKIYSTLEGYIDDIVSYNTQRTLSGRTLDPSKISSRELRLAVPEQTTPQQWQQISGAVEYGNSQGVKVIVTPVH